VKNFELEKDLIEAYAHAAVKLIQEVERTWYKDASSGDCFKVRIKAEVVPDSQMMNRVEKGISVEPIGSARCSGVDGQKGVQGIREDQDLSPGKQAFLCPADVQERPGRNGSDPAQSLPVRKVLQRRRNIRNPSGSDRFDLEVSPPFGEGGRACVSCHERQSVKRSL